MKDEIRIKWCLPENSEEVLKVSHSLKTSGFWNVAVGLVFYVFPILLVFCIMGHSFRISSALVAVLCSTAVGSVPLAYGLFLIRAAHTLLTTEEIREVRKIAVIVGYCPLSLMWGGVLGGRLLAIIANDKTCIDRFVMKTCIINLLILWIIFAVLSFIYGVFSSAPSVCEVVAYVLGEDASERSFERQTIASKPSSKMGRVRRITSQRSFVRHDDARRIVAGSELSDAINVPSESVRQLSRKASEEMSVEDRAQMASDKNQVMDELLNLPSIPEDYGEQMIALFRDGEQDVFTRDFAVQHIGLYAQALRRRGKYNPESPESASLRRALDEAASETKTIIAAAAFRALSDMAVFDPNIDRHRLDSRLVACISDSGASVAARVVAVQLCGERRIGSARSALAALAADAATPETLRRSAIYASAFIGGK